MVLIGWVLSLSSLPRSISHHQEIASSHQRRIYVSCSKSAMSVKGTRRCYLTRWRSQNLRTCNIKMSSRYFASASFFGRANYLACGLQEFYAKCRSSQELIFAAIPWASAGAERSRRAEGRDGIQQKRSHSGGDPTQPRLIPGQEEHYELTVEERLLAELLAANEELTAALRQYDDLERVGIERDTEERSKKETRIDRNVRRLFCPAQITTFTRIVTATLLRYGRRTLGASSAYIRRLVAHPFAVIFSFCFARALSYNHTLARTSAITDARTPHAT